MACAAEAYAADVKHIFIQYIGDADTIGRSPGFSLVLEQDAIVNSLNLADVVLVAIAHRTYHLVGIPRGNNVIGTNLFVQNFNIDGGIGALVDNAELRHVDAAQRTGDGLEILKGTLNGFCIFESCVHTLTGLLDDGSESLSKDLRFTLLIPEVILCNTVSPCEFLKNILFLSIGLDIVDKTVLQVVL